VVGYCHLPFLIYLFTRSDRNLPLIGIFYSTGVGYPPVVSTSRMSYCNFSSSEIFTDLLTESRLWSLWASGHYMPPQWLTCTLLTHHVDMWTEAFETCFESDKFGVD
jgi:hypothetical protein